MKNNIKIIKRAAPLLAAAVWIGLWWLAAAILNKPLILPSPLAVLQALWQLLQTADFYRTVAFSIGRILAGLSAAILGGALLALLTTKRVFYHFFSPLLSILKSTPVVSVIFLVLLWSGRDTAPALIAFSMALPVVWGNLREGLAAADPKLLEMARLFSVSPVKRLFRLQLPMLLPYLLAACRSAVTLAFKSGIAAEVLCLPQESIGRAIYEGNWYLLTDELFAWTLVVILLGAAAERLTLLAVKRIGGDRFEEVKPHD